MFLDYRPGRGRGFGDRGQGEGKNFVRGDRGRFVAQETNEGCDEENHQDGPEEHFIGDDDGAKDHAVVKVLVNGNISSTVQGGSLEFKNICLRFLHYSWSSNNCKIYLHFKPIREK